MENKRYEANKKVLLEAGYELNEKTGIFTGLNGESVTKELVERGDVIAVWDKKANTVMLQTSFMNVPLRGEDDTPTFKEMIAGISECQETQKTLKAREAQLRKELESAMRATGSMRVANEEIGKQAVLSTTKRMEIVNDLLAIGSLKEHGVSEQSYMLPNKARISSLLKQLKADGKEVKGVMEVEKETITLRGIKNK